MDRVLPHVPVRQWVLSLPFKLLYRLAWDHKLCSAVLRIYTRALLGFDRKQAKSRGHPEGRTGTVTVIQRFGDALNLNVHFHTLVLDGVFVRDLDRSLSFVVAKSPTDPEVEAHLRSVAVTPSSRPKRPRHARLGGFDLHADTQVQANNRSRLERLCRYLPKQ